MKRENYANSIFYGFYISNSLNITKWWDSLNEFSFSYKRVNPYLNIYIKDKYNSVNSYLRTNNNFIIGNQKKIFANINFSYYFPSKGEVEYDSRTLLGMGIKYLIYNKRISLSIDFNDILNKNHFHSKTFTQNIYQTFNQYYDSHAFRISISYKIGNNNLNINKRTNSNSDEQNRVN